MYKSGIKILIGILLILFASFVSEKDLQKRSLLKNKIEILIPSNFDTMSDEIAKIKYPSGNKPTLIFTNESASVNIALNHTNNPANQQLISAYKSNFINTFKTNFPTSEFKDSGIVNLEGRKVGFIEIITPAIDTDIYNLIFFTDLENKLLLCTFNCTKKEIDEWSISAKKIMNSLKIRTK